MFSKKGLVNLKFFLIFSLLTLIFTLSLTYTLKNMTLNSEIEELKNIVIDSKRLGEERLKDCSSFHIFTEQNRSDFQEYFIEKNKDGRDFLILYKNGIIIEKDITNINNTILKIIILIFLFVLGVLVLTFLYSPTIPENQFYY